jgi:very-short-patch-repair endonuclease
MIAVEYDGDQHRTDRIRYAWDVKRLRMIQECGWIHIKVIAEDRGYDIVNRVRAAWTRRETEGNVVGGVA